MGPDGTSLEHDRAALRWLAEHLDEFAPPGVLDDDALGKPLLELLALMIHRLRDGLPLDACSTEIVERLVAVAESSALREGPINNRNQLVLKAGMCALLRLAGRPDQAHEAAVQRAIDTGLIDQAERLPHHYMIERTVLDWGGFRHALPDLGELTAQSLLFRRPDALFMTRTTAYELTHDIMFGYTLGERDANELAAEYDGLRQVLSDALVRFGRERHWDLVGELLMCWDILVLPRDGIYEAGWRAFTGAQHADGSVIAVEVPAGSAADALEEGRKRFDARYHTTLVLAFASTARQRRDDDVFPPPAAPVGDQDEIATDTAWLGRLVGAVGPGREPRVLLSALIGHTLLGARGPDLPAPLDHLVDRISASVRTPDQLAEVPATQTLTAFGILRDRGVAVPAISGFVEAIRQVVTATPSGDAADLSWLEKHVVLARLGLADPPPLPTLDQVWASVAAGDDLTVTAELAGGCTAYGTAAPADLTEADALGARRLEALGVDTLRRRDLITGCALVRAAHAIRPLDDARVRAVTTFLRAQQAVDGGYGFVTPDGADGIDVDADVRLPLALTVWWTLAELETGYRMFGWAPVGAEARPEVPA
ncbi:DUF6895 family protein [Marmoricola sp. RAF53]|uniref:DUF6895 family protein n=1 Tax=Marmoricola sp. RAF53 TaxID=3233059 RepID=UPI003F96BDEF